MADALGLGDAATKHAAAVFLQQTGPGVPMQDYDFHSGGVIDMLENLQKNFRTEKADVDAAEVKSVSEHDIFVQEKTDLLSRKNSELAAAKEMKDQKIAAIESNSEELTTTVATLLDDQKYLKE